MAQGHSCKEGQISITITCYSSVFGCTEVWLQVTILCLCLSYFPGSLALDFSKMVGQTLLQSSQTGFFSRFSEGTTQKA